MGSIIYPKNILEIPESVQNWTSAIQQFSVPKNKYAKVLYKVTGIESIISITMAEGENLRDANPFGDIEKFRAEIYPALDVNIPKGLEAKAPFPNLLVNGDFSNGLNNWTERHGGGSANIEAGALVLSAVTNRRFAQVFQQINVEQGKRYFIKYTIARSTRGGSWRIDVGGQESVIQIDLSGTETSTEMSHTILVSGNGAVNFEILFTGSGTNQGLGSNVWVRDVFIGLLD